MNEEIEALRNALDELGFERIDAHDPSAPIAIKHFADGDLEVTVHFERMDV
jgi:hypothetical protein